MQQVEHRSNDGGRVLALWRVLLWLVAIWAVAEVPLGTGLQSVAPGTRLAVSADTGEERPGGIAAVLLEAETSDGNGPPEGLTVADTGDEPGLAWLAGREFVAADATVFTAHRYDHYVTAAPQSPFARGPPALG